MENNKKKGILPIIIMMIITVCAVIASAVMYGMVLQTNINENDTNISDTTIEENNSENKSDEKEVDKFAEYQENYKKAFKEFMKTGYTIRLYPPKSEILGTNTAIPGVNMIYVDSNNDAYFEFEEDSQLYAKYGKTYKVESNVANIFICPNGNGGYADVVFLKLDGTASSVSGYSLEQNPVVKCEKIEGVENAVNVITYTAGEYNESGEAVGSAWPENVFIDINGNVIKKY